MQGGTYINEGGELRRVGGTEDHPDGNRARDAEGARLNRPNEVAPEAEASGAKEGSQRPRSGGPKKVDVSTSAPVAGASKEA